MSVSFCPIVRDKKKCFVKKLFFSLPMAGQTKKAGGFFRGKFFVQSNIRSRGRSLQPSGASYGAEISLSLLSYSQILD
jgi:hypothetical protein